MIVLTDEMIAMTDRYMEGIEVSDETLMLNEIDREGPGGNFLTTELTLNRFREFWYPSLLDRRRREEWLEAGAKTMNERLNTRVREIIAEHEAKPLDPEKKGEGKKEE